MLVNELVGAYENFMKLDTTTIVQLTKTLKDAATAGEIEIPLVLTKREVKWLLKEGLQVFMEPTYKQKNLPDNAMYYRISGWN